MQKTIHRSNTRGFFDYDWLKTYHTFSFSYYYDPLRMNFGMLRVLNDDFISPKTGFDMHPHNNMEVISIPISGELRHEDSQGHIQIIRPDDVQLMSAGSGIFHSEYNNSDIHAGNFLQIWIYPFIHNTNPGYEIKSFSKEDRINQFQLLISPDENDNALTIKQNAYLALCDLQAHKSIYYKKHLETNGVYFFVIDGNIIIDRENLLKRDGIGIIEETDIFIESNSDSNILTIEVPMLSQENDSK